VLSAPSTSAAFIGSFARVARSIHHGLISFVFNRWKMLCLCGDTIGRSEKVLLASLPAISTRRLLAGWRWEGIQIQNRNRLLDLAGRNSK
jgi:hypothetical protein